MPFDDFDLGPQCEEIYNDDYFANHDGMWDVDSDCYIRKEFWYEAFED